MGQFQLQYYFCWEKDLEIPEQQGHMQWVQSYLQKKDVEMTEDKKFLYQQYSWSLEQFAK